MVTQKRLNSLPTIFIFVSAVEVVCNGLKIPLSDVMTTLTIAVIPGNLFPNFSNIFEQSELKVL